MANSTCPVCHDSINADTAAFTHHVNSHFTGNTSPSKRPVSQVDTGPSKRNKVDSPPSHDITCFVCGFPIGYLSDDERGDHVNACLDGNTPPDVEGEDDDFIFSDEAMQRNGQLGGDNRVDKGWDGPAKPGKWSDWIDKKVDKGDTWWDPTMSHSKKDIPHNFSPSLIPLLRTLLLQSFHNSQTRSAAVCRDITHIKGSWGFDMGWGCGYRNALMAISALKMGGKEEGYGAVWGKEGNGCDPGVRRVQGWIEEAWEEGFDVEGKEQLRGKVLGTRKWVGTTDLYAMFSYKGIPCKLYDFPKPRSGRHDKPAHVNLQGWVKVYFDEDGKKEKKVHSQTAADVLMRAGRGDNVRMTNRYPLILQHSGHSRTIIGYEETASGAINLLLFDPGKTTPKDLRAAGIEDLDPPTAPQRRVSSQSRDSSNDTESRGWVSKKVKKVLNKDKNGEGSRPWEAGGAALGKALGYFRVNMSSLGKHDQFQVLCFTAGGSLDGEARERKKVVSSIVVR